jgi:apolipoprotein D and lipocalin family protein
MKRLLSSLFAAIACLAPLLAAASDGAVTPVLRVDLERYLGRWYEIGSFPMFFQRNCIADTTAEYSPREAGGIVVRNRCRTADGFIEAEGKAVVVPESGNARLKVSFFWPFSSDYWIIGLDDDYRWAVVGNPNRKYLWILSRTPELSAAELEKARSVAAAQGYDLSMLRMTLQGQP